MVTWLDLIVVVFLFWLVFDQRTEGGGGFAYRPRKPTKPPHPSLRPPPPPAPPRRR